MEYSWENLALRLERLPVLPQINEDVVVNASRQFWEQMLRMPVEPLPEPAPGGLDRGHMVGSVVLAGAWMGKVEVRLAAGLVYEATAAMLMGPREMVSPEDALDATREIANMIAGVIKSSLPRPCTMSIPSAQVGEGVEAWSGMEDCVSVGFRHASGEFLVRVLSHDSRRGEAG